MLNAILWLTLMVVPNVNPNCISPTAPHCVDISWTAPTANTDGTPITGTLTYNVARSATLTGNQTFLFTTPIAGLSYEDATVAGGSTWYYFITALETVNGVVSISGPLTIGPVTVPLSVPNAPGGASVIPH